MQRTALALALTLAAADCDEPKQSAQVDPDTSTTADPEIAEHAERMAREGFANAEEAEPPPPTGTTWPLLRITKPDREPDELAYRLAAVLDTMGVHAQPSVVSTWSAAAAVSTEADDWELVPGVVVSYDGQLDDMEVVNVELLDAPTDHGADDDALVAVAQRVASELAAAGVVELSLAATAYDVTTIRSGLGGPNGEHEEWVDEILFDLAHQVEGIPLADAGLRIGVTPAGTVSSVKVVGAIVEQAGRVTVSSTVDELEDAFAAHVAGFGLVVESVYVSRRLPMYVLYQDVTFGIVEPRYVIVYTVTVRDGDIITGSRSTVTAWSLTDPLPTAEVWP
jgi:hypothetical protein